MGEHRIPAMVKLWQAQLERIDDELEMFETRGQRLRKLIEAVLERCLMSGSVREFVLGAQELPGKPCKPFGGAQGKRPLARSLQSAAQPGAASTKGRDSRPRISALSHRVVTLSLCLDRAWERVQSCAFSLRPA